MERYGFNGDGTVRIKQTIEDEGKLREQLEELLSTNGFKLTSEKIKISKEKMIEILKYLPHDLGNLEKYKKFQLKLAIALLQNRDNPFIIGYFENEEDRKNLVGTYIYNENVYLESYINPELPHPKNYDFEKDCAYIIYLERVNSKNENMFKRLRLPN